MCIGMKIAQCDRFYKVLNRSLRSFLHFDTFSLFTQVPKMPERIRIRLENYRLTSWKQQKNPSYSS